MCLPTFATELNESPTRKRSLEGLLAALGPRRGLPRLVGGVGGLQPAVVGDVLSDGLGARHIHVGQVRQVVARVLRLHAAGPLLCG